MSRLFRENLGQLRNQPGLVVPDDSIFQLPEKVLQFGTGAFLRGLADYFIDKANRQGVFNGRIVVVKSTDEGDLKAFERQDNLYTICLRGSRNGIIEEENIISSAISRVLSAKTQWSLVLDLAKNPAVSIVISNTTEIGIQLVQDDIYQWPPVSFPGKLLAFLYARYVAFGGNPEYGVVIIPTELITDNGKKLESIVLELAHRNGLEGAFIDWLENHNSFCNSLVDRIVPGRPDENICKELAEELGYQDDLLIMAEHYHLWAIEGDAAIGKKLPFKEVDEGMIVEPDIELHRELKLRLLNGAHTLGCGLAHLCGFKTVDEAMSNRLFETYITNLMETEIAPAIPYPVAEERALQFGRSVVERFHNPHLRHKWLNISQNYSAKMLSRVMPVFYKYEKTHETFPDHIVFGFAVYIFYMKAVRKDGDHFYGLANGAYYLIQDQKAAYFHQKWQIPSLDDMVKAILKDQSIWQKDLSKSEVIRQNIVSYLESLKQLGAVDTLKLFLEKTEYA
ncbi:tagaturonate reductase [Dyadobacter chenhuakuii]|uniref:Tagaturonate reductase n=1 Tax=Dyadobacter chenhuakuii TaxID=2909339 RepID=A0ABY4XKJ6_9BACT|nr:tagaturonate reductase [Dyadobacter chenhuakuii]MCF2493624.1 tagaturonate reductase [Dyadobacter chenhuakuii]USJ30761.1 tagaturonate reductase [Dyadobacter chenhuakuii]